MLSSGVNIGYEHRVRKNLSVFGDAWLGSNAWLSSGGTPTRYDLDYGALGGLRWTF